MSDSICTVCGNKMSKLGLIVYCSICNSVGLESLKEERQSFLSVLAQRPNTNRWKTIEGFQYYWDYIKPEELLPTDAEYGWHVRSNTVDSALEMIVRDVNRAKRNRPGWETKYLIPIISGNHILVFKEVK